jgi:N-acetylglucosaminyl-diphospho-decaprenol L-rhamnosyltransferase
VSEATLRPDRQIGVRDVELVLVAYRSRGEIEDLLGGLPADLPLVVVDNFDNGDGLRELILARPNGRYLTGGGVGFSRAANQGARTSRAEILVFLNPDTRPRLSDIAAVVEDVATDDRCAGSGGVLVGPDGRVPVGVGGWEPTLGRAAVHALGLHHCFSRAGIYARPRIGEQLDVDWVSGNCMAVRRKTFLEFGCFDEDFYVYNEDVAFGRESRRRGMHVRLRTDVAIAGSSGGSGAPSLEMMRLRGAAMSWYVRRNRPGPTAVATVLCLSVGYAARAGAHLLRGRRTSAREDWAHELGLVTGRATVAGRVVVTRHGRMDDVA